MFSSKLVWSFVRSRRNLDFPLMRNSSSETPDTIFVVLVPWLYRDPDYPLSKSVLHCRLPLGLVMYTWRNSNFKTNDVPPLLISHRRSVGPRLRTHVLDSYYLIVALLGVLLSPDLLDSNTYTKDSTPLRVLRQTWQKTVISYCPRHTGLDRFVKELRKIQSVTIIWRETTQIKFRFKL